MLDEDTRRTEGEGAPKRGSSLKRGWHSGTERSVQSSPSTCRRIKQTVVGLSWHRAGSDQSDTLRLGDITARNLNVVTTPALGDTDVLGMNFLSQLDSWRVEGRTLILVPRQLGRPRDQAEDRTVRPRASRAT
jgi:hypothetical protein